MRVALITGTREDPTPEQLRRLYQALRCCNLAIIGDCPTGIDRKARRFCDIELIENQVMVCDWRVESGPARNARMVERAVEYRDAGHRVICFAFPSPRSKGTWNCERLAREAGLLTRVWT